MVTLDSSGKGIVWLPCTEGEEATIHSRSMVFHLPPDFASVHVLPSGTVWASYDAFQRADGGSKVTTLRVFELDEEGLRVRCSGETSWGMRVGTADMEGQGRVTTAAVVPSVNGRTFIGH
jgi:hypothetical protein